MNKAKALLDSLMGPSRDLSSNEKKGEDFKADNVCKMYLAGFCPDHLLSKRVETIKPCTRIHSQPLKDELESHPDKEKFKAQYERELLHYCLDLVAEVDQTVSIEKKKCRRRETVVKVPEHQQPILQEHEQDRKVKIAMAERLGNEGDVDGATKAMADAEACQKLIESMKKLHTREWPGEDMCTVCGTKYLCGSYEDIKGYERPRELDVWENDHMEDKMHLAYKKVRDKIQELKDNKEKRNKERDEERKKETGRDNHGDRGSRRSRSRGDRNKDRDDRRGGDRDRGRGGRDDRRRRSRSRSRRRR